VLEDVMARIAEENGPETMALDWAILNELVEGDSSQEPGEESSA
jgi:hypothetical protein